MRMGLISRLINWLFGSPEPTADPVSSPLTGEGTPTVHVRLFQTKVLTRENGRAPEETVARFLAKAFDKLGYGYEISFGRVPVEVAREEWRPALNRFVTLDMDLVKDANLLLTAERGNGATVYVGAQRGVTGAGKLDKRYEHTWITTDSWASNVLAAMHEVAHMLHVSHEDHTGLGWYADGYFNRTPEVGPTSKSVNKCGETSVNNDRRLPVKRHLYYTNCSKHEFVVR